MGYAAKLGGKSGGGSGVSLELNFGGGNGGNDPHCDFYLTLNKSIATMCLDGYTYKIKASSALNNCRARLSSVHNAPISNSYSPTTGWAFTQNISAGNTYNCTSSIITYLNSYDSDTYPYWVNCINVPNNAGGTYFGTIYVNKD